MIEYDRENDPNYVQYLKVIIRRKQGKINPLMGFRLSRGARYATPKYMQHPDGHVYDRYENLVENRFRYLDIYTRMWKIAKMRRMGGYV